METAKEWKDYLDRVVQKTKEKAKNAGPIKPVAPEDGIDCATCSNTGMICITEPDGHSYMEPCPDCYERRQVVRRLKASGVSALDYEKFTIKSFDGNRSEESRVIKRIAQNYLRNHIQGGPGFGIFGSSGVGKTHICIAICQVLTRTYKEPHYYFSYRSEMPGLIKTLRSFSENYEDALYRWKTCPNMYIDDLFKCAGRIEHAIESSQKRDRLVSIDSDDLRIMYDILNARYLNHLTTLFSSEYSLSDISMIDGALGSRIYEMISPYRIAVFGKNQRQRKK